MDTAPTNESAVEGLLYDRPPQLDGLAAESHLYGPPPSGLSVEDQNRLSRDAWIAKHLADAPEWSAKHWERFLANLGLQPAN